MVKTDVRKNADKEQLEQEINAIGRKKPANPEKAVYQVWQQQLWQLLYELMLGEYQAHDPYWEQKCDAFNDAVMGLKYYSPEYGELVHYMRSAFAKNLERKKAEERRIVNTGAMHMDTKSVRSVSKALKNGEDYEGPRVYSFEEANRPDHESSDEGGMLSTLSEDEYLEVVGTDSLLDLFEAEEALGILAQVMAYLQSAVPKLFSNGRKYFYYPMWFTENATFAVAVEHLRPKEWKPITLAVHQDYLMFFADGDAEELKNLQIKKLDEILPGEDRNKSIWMRTAKGGGAYLLAVIPQAYMKEKGKSVAVSSISEFRKHYREEMEVFFMKAVEQKLRMTGM